MKIVIDGRMIGWTGIGTYTKRLLDNLQIIDQTNQYIVLLLARDLSKWQPSAANFHKLEADFEPYSPIGEQFPFARFLAGLQKREKFDLIHFPSFNMPVFFAGPRVATVHDLTLLYFKNLRGRGVKRLGYEVKYWGMRLVMLVAVGRARRIITPSRFVMAGLEKHYQKLARNKVRVIYEGIDIGEKKSAGGAASRPYLLYVGNAYPNKNLIRLVEAFKLLATKRSELKLVLVGRPDYFLDLVKKRVRELGIGDRVEFPGFVPDSELDDLYAGASLYVFPSLSEGFGIPPLAAMAHGVPVVAANATCLPEVCGQAAVYFDPLDEHDMAQVITSVLDDPAKKDALRRAGQAQVKKYSWRKMAEETLAVYKELAP
jgi:glycosyltransferase involved in cell wall biosynthesis